MGQSVAQYIITKEKTIATGQTLVIDSFDLATWKGHADYTITFRNGNKSRSLKLSAFQVDGSVKDTVFAKVGDNIQIEICAQKNGTSFELTVKNNEAGSIDLSFTRIKP